MRSLAFLLLVLFVQFLPAQNTTFSVKGKLTDPSGGAIAGASVRLAGKNVSYESTQSTSPQGDFEFKSVPIGGFEVTTSVPGFEDSKRPVTIIPGTSQVIVNIQLSNDQIRKVTSSMIITAALVEPAIDRKDAAVFTQTLFSRDDQIFQQLNAGINAGQHEGGGKSLEFRRFGFNLDHGGANGGLKVLVDNVQQNQNSQGHTNGYLGSLKGLTPELVQEVSIINGPFSAEYGDFSALGVVNIRLRDSMKDLITGRFQAGQFSTQRGFLAFSPKLKDGDAYVAYEGSHSDGPFVKPLDYRRDNVWYNWLKKINEHRSFAVRGNAAGNVFNSSGQIPQSEVVAGRLDRFGFIDPGEGGKVGSGLIGGYFRQEDEKGNTWRIDGTASRMLFDLYSNFTFFLNDPVRGDGILQHDSRLQQSANVQHIRPHKVFGATGLFTGGLNYADNQILTRLDNRVVRDPYETVTKAQMRIHSGAMYAQESLSFWDGKVTALGGVRWEAFRYRINDQLDRGNSSDQVSYLAQPKAALGFTPLKKVPLTFSLNYGRSLTSIDARSLLQNRNTPVVAKTDFYQFGVGYKIDRLVLSASTYWIDRSNELVYVADDNTFEFLGPTRSYGFETKAVFGITRFLSINGNITKVSNAFYRNTDPREYIDRAPHFTASSALTLSNWKGWTSSLRYRAINNYLLAFDQPDVRAAGNSVFDFSFVRRINRNFDFNFSMDNVFDRNYLETQNLVTMRVRPNAPVSDEIAATPGYPRTITVGFTFRFGKKE